MTDTAVPSPVKEPVKCALPNCATRFTPKSEKHIYCSSTCKRRGHAYRHVLGRR